MKSLPSLFLFRKTWTLGQLAFFLLFSLMLSGCMSITTHKKNGEEVVMSQKEFEIYVEKVFRYHNQVMNELLESSEDVMEQHPMDAKKLKLAEKKMIESCQPLNEVVSESLAGGSASLQIKMELANSVPACESSTEEVDQLIP